MVQRLLQVAVIDPSAIIAIDAAETLAERLACRADAYTPAQFVAMAQDRHFDLIVLAMEDDRGIQFPDEPVTDRHFRQAIADMARACRAPVILLSTDCGNDRGIPGFEGCPVVLKPYFPDDLVAAAVAALSRRTPAR
ncbi:MAG: hypothetical protein R3D02_10240 [Hyphomicrobiales bacterium]